MIHQILWGAASAIFLSSEIYINHPLVGHCLAANQPTVATIISDQPPDLNPITLLNSWISQSYIGKLNNDHYYQISILGLQQNPPSSRTGKFTIDNTEYKFTQAASKIALVEGASYSRVKVRSEAVCSVFGENLSDITLVAVSVPLPTILNGISVYVTYRSTSSYQQIPSVQCPLFYVSPNQINIILKETNTETLYSNACIWLFKNNGEVLSELTQTADYGGNFQQSPIASIFSAESTGLGIPACYFQIVNETTGVVSDEHVFLYTIPQEGMLKIGNYWTYPISISKVNRSVYCNIYLTGLKLKLNKFPQDTQIFLDDTRINPTYVGVSGFVGVQQVQFRIPENFLTAPKTVKVKVRNKWLDDYFKNGVEWSNELKDINLGNEVFIPLKP